MGARPGARNAPSRAHGTFAPIASPRKTLAYPSALRRRQQKEGGEHQAKAEDATRYINARYRPINAAAANLRPSVMVPYTTCVPTR